MSHNRHYIGNILRVADKEINLFFSSPVAYLFLGVFAAVTLFIFFWGESFYARNIADVRPLFEWLPVLLIFLCSTLTMRMWSEEKRSGTLEHVTIQPVPIWVFVVGKFLACLTLLGLALVISLPLPLTVEYLGDLDRGPVLAGYLAALFLGATYISVGLFASSRTNNPIVALIGSVVLCGVLYLPGSALLTDFVGTGAAEMLRLAGTGSRFSDITRGIIDLRDFYYYVSLIAVFLVLNTWSLERERWAPVPLGPGHRRWHVITGLLIANFLGANLWIGQMDSWRLDVTRGKQYSISDATHKYLSLLREPLLIRGYFSSRTHPLLAPLVPRMRDLIEEYGIAGGDRVRVEFVDPASDPAAEDEANRQFGIRPVPFQVADRYQSSIVSSYFNVLVQYGDEYQVLDYQDLIDFQARGETDIDVRLRNPEYDLTQTIRKVMNSYQAAGNLFDTISGDLAFTAYVSADDQLPEALRRFRAEAAEILQGYQARYGDRLRVQFIDPDADGGTVARRIAEEWGLQPLSSGLFSQDRFHFHMILENDRQAVQIALDNFEPGVFERNLKAGIKRFATGFTKTVALVTPMAGPPSPYAPPRSQFSQLEQFLGAELEIRNEDLGDGSVSPDADILVVVAPADLDEKSVFAIDQFLMQGGSVILATSPFDVSIRSRRLIMEPRISGLEDWLGHHGIRIDSSVVKDEQNAAFPVPVTRQVGGLEFQEVMMLDYPYFVDVRQDGLDRDNPVSGTLPQLNMAFPSPIHIDSGSQGGRSVTQLIRSSERSWTSDDLDITPRLENGDLEIETAPEDASRQLLGVVVSGRFDSYFQDRESPLLKQASDGEATGEQAGGNRATENPGEEEQAGENPQNPLYGSVIRRSPDSARLMLFGSNDFLSDDIMQISGSATGTNYLTPLQMIANAVDWSLDDPALVSIRARGHFNRTLPPIDGATQLALEYANYAAALLLIGAMALWQGRRRRTRVRAYREILQSGPSL
jgi:ABC-2 type transport system permease protein